MKGVLALCLLLAVSGARAGDSPASEASVRQLLEVTQTKQLLDNMMGQADAMMQNTMKQAAGGATFTPEQQAVMDEMRSKMLALLASEMKWETLESDFIDIYRKSFTEQDIAGMLEFYRTKAGQAVLTKMPVVMQHSMELMQRKMLSMSPKMQQIQRESVEKMKACCTNGR